MADAKRLILEQANQENVDVVAFTGDIAYSGKESEYRIAHEWLDDLCLQPSGLNLDPLSVMFVPGNHDVDRKAITPAATAIENGLASASVQADVANFYQDPDSLELLTRRHAAYFSFCEAFTGTSDIAKMCWSRVFDFHGKHIRFDGFNSSWLCRGDDDHRRLLVGQPQLSEVLQIRDEADVAIALAHHPLADLMEFDERNVESHLRQHHDLFLRGHLHHADTVRRDTPNGTYLELAAGALHETHEKSNHFSVVDLSDDLREVSVSTFAWHDARWILDRNIFTAAADGIGKFPLSENRSKNSPTSSVAGSQDSDGENREYLPLPSDRHAEERRVEAEDVEDALRSFPRFQKRASQRDLAIRQSLLAEAMLLADTDREVRIRKDAGSQYESFVASFAHEFQRLQKDATVLHAACGGVSSGRDLQDILAINAQCSITAFAAALRKYGPCVMVLDDLDAVDHVEEEHASVDETIQALLDLCEGLVVLRISGLPLSGDNVIRVGALDAPDTREYLESAEAAAKLDSSVDYVRVHRVTGGLPAHLDAVVDALTVTNLEGALAQIESEPCISTTALPDQIVHEVNVLKDTSDPEFLRIRRLLWTLSILERGESLSVIKRLDSRQPIWARHANYLEQRGCLDIVDASPKHYQAQPSVQPAHGEKILRVPRMVRDHVVSLMSNEERVDLTKAAAALYFGSDWRLGTVRMRRRVAFSNEISTHRSGNEMTILRSMSSESALYFAESSSSAYSLGISYVSQLQSKGFYGEAYEAARDFLGITSTNGQAISDKELQHLQVVSGGCARMIGERAACVEFLSNALPSIRNSKNRDVLSEVLVDLSLAYQALGKADEAIEAANEIIENTPKESSDYFQAKAILVELDADQSSKVTRLKRLATRARNLGHHTVADNIVLELSSEVDDTEEKLKLLAHVKSRGEREYNYVRATIRRIETLLDAGRLANVTQLDERDLWRSYSLAYSQRLSGVFDWCHRVCWRYLELTGLGHKLGDLFMLSSFVWRLNGDSASERTYLEKLRKYEYDRSNEGGPLARLLTYCKSRLEALEKRIN